MVENSADSSGRRFIQAIALENLTDHIPFVFAHANLSILIIKTENGVLAIENRCSHADAPLECGRIRDGWISCPAHGARFALATGEALSAPAQEPIATFEARIVDGMVEIAV